MAETIGLKVKCHACGNLMTGTAKYGKGQYNHEGLEFEFIAVGKYKTSSGKNRVKGQAFIICPECEVKNRFDV